VTGARRGGYAPIKKSRDGSGAGLFIENMRCRSETSPSRMTPSKEFPSCQPHVHFRCAGRIAVSARSSRSTAKNGKSPCLFPARTASAPSSKSPWPWRALHGRRRPCQSLHQHILVQGASLFFSRLPGNGQARSPCRRAARRGHEPFLPQSGLRSHRWRNRRDARFYPPGELRSCWLIVGAVERKKLLTGKGVQPGDTLIALPSAGLHTNGYSLARKLVLEVAKLKPTRMSRKSEIKLAQSC